MYTARRLTRWSELVPRVVIIKDTKVIIADKQKEMLKPTHSLDAAPTADQTLVVVTDGEVDTSGSVGVIMMRVMKQLASTFESVGDSFAHAASVRSRIERGNCEALIFELETPDMDSGYRARDSFCAHIRKMHEGQKGTLLMQESPDCLISVLCDKVKLKDIARNRMQSPLRKQDPELHAGPAVPVTPALKNDIAILRIRSRSNSPSRAPTPQKSVAVPEQPQPQQQPQPQPQQQTQAMRSLGQSELNQQQQQQPQQQQEAVVVASATPRSLPGKRVLGVRDDAARSAARGEARMRMLKMIRDREAIHDIEKQQKQQKQQRAQQVQQQAKAASSFASRVMSSSSAAAVATEEQQHQQFGGTTRVRELPAPAPPPPPPPMDPDERRVRTQETLLSLLVFQICTRVTSAQFARELAAAERRITS